MWSRAGRYLTGLCAAALALLTGGWLVLTPFAFGLRGRERVTSLATGGGLALVAAVTVVCWSLAWRRKLRADGVLPPAQSRRLRRSARRQGRAERLVRATRQRELPVAPDPAQVLTDLRQLLTPLLADQPQRADQPRRADQPERRGVPEVILPRRSPENAVPAAGDTELDTGAAELDTVIAEPDIDGAEPSHVVQAPGHLRGIRSASFLSTPTADAAVRYADVRSTADVAAANGAGDLLHGAELLVVGGGEEESW